LREIGAAPLPKRSARHFTKPAAVLFLRDILVSLFSFPSGFFSFLLSGQRKEAKEYRPLHPYTAVS
jgi:hypothetical protein